MDAADNQQTRVIRSPFAPLNTFRQVRGTLAAQSATTLRIPRPVVGFGPTVGFGPSNPGGGIGVSKTGRSAAAPHRPRHSTGRTTSSRRGGLVSS